MPTPQNFADLLQQAEQLTADIDAGEELPRVRRNLQQIAEAGQRLLDKTSGVLDEGTDVKASILLGSRGFDVPKLSHKLESLNAAKTLEPIEPVWEADIQGFLKNERENTLLAVIEESRKNTFTEAERHHWQSMEGEWEREKEKILNSLLGSGHELDFPSEAEVLHASPLSMQGRSALDAVAMAYAREVYVRNEAALQGISHGLIPTFHSASTKFVDTHITECWSLLKTLVDVPNLPPRAFECLASPTQQKAFVTQARHHLEMRYLEYIQESVYRSLSQAQLGGVPGTYQLVRSFLNLRQANSIPGLEDGSVAGQPLWALVFYCMRCGNLQDALSALRNAQSCAEFAACLQEYIQSEDQRLSPSSEARLQLNYKRTVRSSTDPFKRAVYCLLARCDVADNHPDVCSKTDDYMWLKLCQVQFESEGSPATHPTPAADKVTLPQLQALLLEEYGEGHFNAAQQPYLYFQVLLLTVQFEAAIEFLSRQELLQTHAVHFAIALQDMELLNLTDSTQSKLLVKDPTGVRRLNFARLVIGYTRRFALTDPREALQYFYLLKGMKGPQGQDLFDSCVSELVMESREFEMLLGRIQPDGSRKPGCIDKFQRDTSETIGFIASEAESKGLYEDAVRLYDLAKNHGKVLEVINKLLSNVASAPTTPQSDRDRLQTLALSIAERYKSHGHSAPRQLSHTFFLLLDVMQFFNHYHGKRVELAFDVMKQLRLLPLQAGETVEQKVASFRSYDDEIRHCFPDILLATMSILYTRFKQISASSPKPSRGTKQDGGQEQHKAELRQLARTLITFAGMIPYQLPGDTNARLVQMEVLMS